MSHITALIMSLPCLKHVNRIVIIVISHNLQFLKYAFLSSHLLAFEHTVFFP